MLRGFIGNTSSSPGTFNPLTATGLFTQAAENGLTAHAGGGQGSALALDPTKNVHRVTTVATTGDSVALPASSAGQVHYICNMGANPMQVYGTGSDVIDTAAAATGIVQWPNTEIIYVCNVTGQWCSTTNNAPKIVGKAVIPFISLSSGSVAANGAISGITALPRTVSNAYCWFPANALATSIAAGWYYCTFSSTTAGTAFLNTYTSGLPTIPTSPTAVTDGKGAFTGDTGEEFGLTITIPANSMGTSGGLRITTAYQASPANANVKTVRVRFSGNGGTAMMVPVLTSSVIGTFQMHIFNQGVTNVQISTMNVFGTVQQSYGVTGSGPLVTSAVDTTANTTLVFSLQKATATDNIVQELAIAELIM